MWLRTCQKRFKESNHIGLHMLKVIICIVVVSLQTSMFAQNGNNTSCLFKNPLCFYSTDILTYLQILYKNSRYEEMLPFLHEPQELKKLGKSKAIKLIESMNFGYEMKRVGIKEEKTGKQWKITYQRIILGTSETFTITCGNVQDTTRLLMNTTQRKSIFYRKRP